MSQLPIRNTFIEVRAPATVRPRSQTDFVPGPVDGSTQATGAPVLAKAPAPAAPAPSACVVSSIETVASRRCSVTRTPDVLFPRTPLGSFAMDPPHAFALPQALDELQRRRTSTLSSEAARVQTSHSATTRRSSLDMIPSTPDMYYSWPVDANPAAFMLPSAASGQVPAAPAPVPLSTSCPIKPAYPAGCAAQAIPAAPQVKGPPPSAAAPVPVSWDGAYAAPTAPTAPTMPLQVVHDKPLNVPMWPQPAHMHPTVLPSRYPLQHPQQVLVLSNFLQEAPKMDELSPMQADSQPYDAAALHPVAGVTTMMLRNIPVTFNRETLLADFDARGLRGRYDFFYLPIDFQTGNNLGYAFVNFVSPMFAEQFRAVYQGLALAGDRSKKICAVASATTQGRLANVEYYRNSPVMSMEEKYHPLVFDNGIRQKFPAPTKAVKPIRFRESRGMQGE